MSRNGSGDGEATNDQVTASTGEIAAGTTLAPEKGADTPVSTHQNEVFRIHGIELSHASYGNNSTVVTEAVAFGPKAAVESAYDESAGSRPLTPMYDVPYDDLLAWMEWDIYTNNSEGVAHKMTNDYIPAAEPGVVIDYPLGEIWQAGQADASATDTHVWADCTFIGEVVEVSEDYNLTLLRSAMNKWMG